jgi:hypothetical protein
VKAPRVRTETLVLVGGVFVLFTGVLLVARRPAGLGRDPGDLLRGSTHYTSPSGGKAFYTLLRDLGRTATRHSRKTELLSDDVRLLVLFAPSRALTEAEAGHLAAWVAEGGSVLWCPRSGGSGDDRLLEAFGLSSRTGSDDESSEVSATLEPLGGGAGVRYALSVTGDRRLAAGEGTRAEVLAEDRAGWIAAVVRKGQGRLIALAEPRLLSNRGLALAAHAEFAVHLASLAAGKGRIAFDEYHHGFEHGQGALALVRDSSLFPALLLSGLAAFLGVLASGRRLGPPLRLRRGERRRPTEFIDAFAGLCRKRRAAAQAREILRQEFRLFVRQHGGGGEAEALLRRGAVDEAGLVAWCRELEARRRSILNRNAARAAK